VDQQALLSALGDWKGFEVSEVERRAGNPEEIWITLRPRSDEALRCGHCGAVANAVHEQIWREVRDLPVFDARTYLKVLVYRVLCSQCGGPKRMAIDWLDEHQRVTRRLAGSIVQLCAQLPIRHVAHFYGVHWHTVKRLDKRALKHRLEPSDWSGVKVIGIDEFALYKGHRYATVVVEPSRKRVLWVGPGRGREDLRPFFEQLGEAGCERIEAVVMDMNGAYEREVLAQCPKARIVFDLYHVVAKYAREVVTRVRSQEASRLQDNPSARRVIKSSRWLLLRNRENLSAADAIRLEELLKANQALMTVYVLKDDLKQLWRMRNEKQAKRLWRQWYARAMQSDIQPLMLFAQRLKPYLHGILAHCRWPLHTGLIEGMNNRIKVIKRMAYGYRDQEYFFLKIRAAFPGLVR
jgi:transposase